MVHTFGIALVVWLASNTRASHAAHGLTTLLLGSGGGRSQADGVLDCLHDCCLVVGCQLIDRLSRVSLGQCGEVRSVMWRGE